jgi:voltage-gated potassium channel
MKSYLRRVASLLVILAAVIIAGTLGFMYLQKLSLFDAFYFTIVSITTVGYGDIIPTTFGSMVLAIIIILGGVGVFSGLLVSFTQFLIERKTDKARYERLNMLVELFFSEIGNKMLRYFSSADTGLDQLRNNLNLNQGNHDAELAQIQQHLKNHIFKIETTRIDLVGLKTLLDNNTLLLRLLENPNLIENQAFTDVLRTTFHFRQELAARGDLTVLPAIDLEHLTDDATRAYKITVQEWISHISYIQKNYPYLFSLTMRTGPFRGETAPIIK